MKPESSRPTRRRQRRRFSPRKALRLFVPLTLFIFLCILMCRPTGGPEEQQYGATQAEAVMTKSRLRLADLLKDTVSAYLERLPEMPEPCRRIHVNYFGNMRQHFNDSNHVHWAEAEAFGLTPLTDTRSHWQNPGRVPLVRITTGPDYYLDTLIFSRPYLVPLAAARLKEIGQRFRDSIESRGGGDYRVKVTSLLRTPAGVKRLRRRNRNAVDSSVHQLGTTFDISYASFIASSPEPARSVDDLKGILAEVLRAMRNEGKIYVKYEVHQPCFHITARKPD